MPSNIIPLPAINFIVKFCKKGQDEGIPNPFMNHESISIRKDFLIKELYYSFYTR